LVFLDHNSYQDLLPNRVFLNTNCGYFKAILMITSSFEYGEG